MPTFSYNIQKSEELRWFQIFPINFVDHMPEDIEDTVENYKCCKSRPHNEKRQEINFIGSHAFELQRSFIIFLIYF